MAAGVRGVLGARERPYPSPLNRHREPTSASTSQNPNKAGESLTPSPTSHTGPPAPNRPGPLRGPEHQGTETRALKARSKHPALSTPTAHPPGST